jgi:hypothetical protein
MSMVLRPFISTLPFVFTVDLLFVSKIVSNEGVVALDAAADRVDAAADNAARAAVKDADDDEEEARVTPSDRKE